jgi:hypothetical protein
MALKLPTTVLPPGYASTDPRDPAYPGKPAFGPGTTAPGSTGGGVPGVGASYPYETGVDPTYDAWLGQFAYQKSKAQADADYKLGAARQAYNNQYSTIDNQAKGNRTNLQTSLLQRGVFNSGETTTRQADLEADVLRQQATVDQQFAAQYADFSKDLADAIASLDLQNQSNMAQARDRVETKKLLEAQKAAAAAAVPVAAPAPAAAPRPAAPRPAAPKPAPRPAAPVARPGPSVGAAFGLAPKKPAPAKKPLTKLKGAQ